MNRVAAPSAAHATRAVLISMPSQGSLLLRIKPNAPAPRPLRQASGHSSLASTQPASDTALSFLSWQHDFSLGAFHDGEEFRPFGRRHAELVERLLEIVEERLPFLFRDVQMGMGIVHGPARVPLRPSGSLTHLLGH